MTDYGAEEDIKALRHALESAQRAQEILTKELLRITTEHRRFYAYLSERLSPEAVRAIAEQD